MASKEIELELQLRQYNAKLVFYNRLYKLAKVEFFKSSILKKMFRVSEKRDECFRELRELIRKKYPDKFISSEGSQ